MRDAALQRSMTEVQKARPGYGFPRWHHRRFSVTSHANAAFLSRFSGTDCLGVFGGSFRERSYNGSLIIIKFNPGGAVEINSAVFPTFRGEEFSFSLTSSGSRTYTPGQGEPLITA